MKTCALIPTYNNISTIRDVVSRTLAYLPVIVVADGSSDGTLEVVQGMSDANLTIVSYPVNRGKGYALKQGFLKAKELGYTHVVTLDADGQHYPEDIPLLLRMSRVRPDAIIVGSRRLQQANMPRKNTFANRFSNFWFALQTGLRLPDTQTGFRVYPLDGIHGLWCLPPRYEAELLLLVLSVWALTPAIPVPVRVYYPPQEERVSFFRPGIDFTRISVMNTILCVLAVVYGLPRRYIRTAYWGILFILYVLAEHIYVPFYLLFVKQDAQAKVRAHLSATALCYLHSFPGAPYNVYTDPDAEPINPSEPAIYIANHTSLLDTLVVLSLHDKMVLVGKDSVLNNPFFGLAARMLGVIAVGEGIDTMLPQLQQYVRKGYSIVIFPEGTRSLTGDLLRFHRGAFYVAEQLHLPIRPIVLRGFLAALSKTPFLVGVPKELAVTVKPLIRPEDASYGVGYRERTKQIYNCYKDWICE